MIANKKQATQDKEKGKHVSDILDYLLKEGKHIIEKDSVSYADTINCEYSISDYELFKREMVDQAYVSTRSKNPMVHIVLSFKKGEHPKDEQAKEAVETVLHELGYDKCKTVFSLHTNTDNDHIHIGINRVNPETGLVCSDSNDIYKIHKAIARIEKAQGWEREKEGLYIVIDEELHSAVSLSEKQQRLSEGARMSEIHSGLKSTERIAVEELKTIMLDSKSWKELHKRLALKSFQYIQKGGGAVIKGHFEDGEKEIKASTVSNAASLKKLEKKLGKFQSSTIENVEKRMPEPIIKTDDNTINQAVNQYVSEKIEKTKEIFTIAKVHEEERRKLTEERIRIYSAMYEKTEGKGLAIDALKSVMSEYHKELIEELAASYKEKMEKGKQALKSVSDFEVWMSLNCPSKKETVKDMLEKAVNTTVPVERITEQKYQNKIDDFIEYHKAVNADRYRITARGEKDGKPIAFTFKTSSDVSEGYTPEEVQKNIWRMSKYESQLEHIYLTPISDDRIHILVDDMTPDSLERMKKDGFIPSCVIQSSPNSIQSIFTIPKPQTEYIKEAANAISRGLNTRYGDINLSGQEHPHRAPGFINPKLVYQDRTGAFPRARIIETNPGADCEKMLSFIAYQSELYAERGHAQGNHARPITLRADMPERDETKKSLYEAHRADILRITGLGSGANESRLDAMIAERLRATGHTQAQIEDVLFSGVDQSRLHDWTTYVPLTAAHAFGPDASHRIDMLQKFHKSWKSIEKSVIEEMEKRQAAQEKTEVRSRGYGMSR